MSDLSEPPLVPPAESSDDDSAALAAPLAQPIEPPVPAKIPAAYLLGLAALGVIYVAMLAIGGEFRSFALMGFFAIPFVALTVLAYSASAEPGLKRYLTGAYWLVLMGLIGLLAMLFSVGAIALPSLGPRADAAARDSFPTMEQSLRILAAILSLIVAGLLSFACFLPVIRKTAARITGMDADSFVHATAFATSIAITLIFAIPLLAIGEPPLLAVLSANGELDLPGADQQLRETFYSLIWAVPASFIAVGFPLWRTFREARQRLGLERPSIRQLVFAVAMTGILLLVMPLIGFGIEALWKTMGWEGTDGELIKKLFGFTAGPFAAIIVSIVAGLGEELVFRGVLQPRLGIFLPALMFASVHAMQYDFDALIQVLFLGVVFGVIRKRSNTTTSAIIHGGYDLVLLLTTVHSN